MPSCLMLILQGQSSLARPTKNGSFCSGCYSQAIRHCGTMSWIKSNRTPPGPQPETKHFSCVSEIAAMCSLKSWTTFYGGRWLSTRVCCLMKPWLLHPWRRLHRRTAKPLLLSTSKVPSKREVSSSLSEEAARFSMPGMARCLSQSMMLCSMLEQCSMASAIPSF